MKKILGLALLMLSAMVFVPQVSAQTVYGRNGQVVVVQENQRDNDRHNRRNWRNRGNRRYDNRRYEDNNYGYIVRNEQRYIRVGRRVYRETYRSTYNRYGQLVNRVLINRERVGRYDNYDDYRFRRETGSGFNVYLRF